MTDGPIRGDMLKLTQEGLAFAVICTALGFWLEAPFDGIAFLGTGIGLAVSGGSYLAYRHTTP
jgi:hypothetical protein